jgi:hypothetical protein
MVRRTFNIVRMLVPGPDLVQPIGAPYNRSRSIKSTLFASFFIVLGVRVI